MNLNEPTTLTKRCNCCGLLLSLDNFHNTKDGCRYGKTSKCKSCMKIKNRVRYLRVREEMLSTKAQQYKENTELFASRNRRYRENNPEKVKQRQKRWKSDNKGKVRASVCLRKYSKRQATPKWLSKKEKAQIALYYILSAKLSTINKCKYHVDHIIPILGKTVCGLHVPWNLQVIPAEENWGKSNKFKTDDDKHFYNTPSKP